MIKKCYIFKPGPGCQGSLGVSYLAFSTIKDPNKPFIMKNPNFYCSIECLK